MDLKSLTSSSVVVVGLGMVAVGVATQVGGVHGVIAPALAPLGLGVILTDILFRIGRPARQMVRVRVRRNGR